MSEPVVNHAQPHIKPSKRTKKSKASAKAEADCRSFTRLLTYDDMPTETKTSFSTPWPTDESMPPNCEGDKAGVVLEKLGNERTMFESPESRRSRDLDTYHALFGPGGQMMMSEHPRHYDIFELHRNMRIRRKKQTEDTHGELFGDTVPLGRPTSTSVAVTRDRLFGEKEEESAAEPPKEAPNIVEVRRRLVLIIVL